ncbi:hypothetical protein F5Y13DRAFT_156811 [Hypoxylon sp. FL1857]|nr:hypothetical protein F5Y13DRAFT_156811 [Hypoxylon sp. FL1857]
MGSPTWFHTIVGASTTSQHLSKLLLSLPWDCLLLWDPEQTRSHQWVLYMIFVSLISSLSRTIQPTWIGSAIMLASANLLLTLTLILRGTTAVQLQGPAILFVGHLGLVAPVAGPVDAVPS